MAENEELIGVFIGLESSSYEYIANIVAPYKLNFPIELGCFLLIDDQPNKLVARVIDFVPQGELVSFMGQKWLSDVALEADAIGSDIKKRKISYSVKIKILGSLDNQHNFIPGLRKIPHITSKVIKATPTVIRKILKQALEEQSQGQEIGHYFLDDTIKIKFNLSELDSKRTFIFARAGYGKSNLMKILASSWEKGYGSLVVFDPEGEYAFTDKKSRPGIMDNREAIFITNRQDTPTRKNVYPKLKLNLRDLSPRLILPIIITPKKHDTIFFAKLMGLEEPEWRELVDLFYMNGWNTSLAEINRVLGLSAEESSDSDMKPIRNNLVNPIMSLHDPDSKLLEVIKASIEKDEIVIIDISLIDSKTALWLSSIIVREIFNRNQQNYIEGNEKNLLKATFVVEEAQSVLSDSADLSAFIDLAKEGRKYSLGGIFITQQPSSIPFEILSQADNFFVFHLLSKGDLDSLNRANAHYSGDIITQVLNEPIKGKCYMWTSSQPFVLPVSIKNFEEQNRPNLSKGIQEKSDLLQNILKNVDTEMENPLFLSIASKYKGLGNIDASNKTVQLFRKLSSDEKDYVKSKNGLQKNKAGEDFAITFKYLSHLTSIMHLVS